ncbi:MAG: Hsp20/alpha crystallin family protein, partial [Kiritimatiellaeota bacterium]|nr:Hsp20/alpha crystallin family protein [Kiritimatiellota bacterium]
MDTKSNQIAHREKAEASTEITREGPVYVPATDIYESDTELVVVAEMPGIDEKRVDVSLEEKELSITGTRDEDSAPKGCSLIHHGYTPGSYSRSFKILADVDTGRITAKIA